MNAKFALVTGGAGFLGSHLMDRLVSDGWNEKVEHHKDNPNTEIVRGDLESLQEIHETVKGVDVVFHYAVNPKVSTTNPEMHFNENVLTNSIKQF